MPGRDEARAAKQAARLGGFLDALVERYHRPEFLGSDPLALVHALPPGADREVGGLLAALLAYGNVKQIQRSLTALFARMDGHPAAFALHAVEGPVGAQAALAGFKHRFTTDDDILCLCYLLGQALAEGDGASLEPFFLRGQRHEDSDLAPSAGRFVENLLALRFPPATDRAEVVARQSFKHLLPRADRGSACKRVHLWLRWMVRPADGVDLGLWREVSPARLLVPVDTHILRIAGNLGLTARRTHSLAASREITAALRRVCSHDPARYDFALCRLGILQACPTRSNLAACEACELRTACRKHALLARRR